MFYRNFTCLHTAILLRSKFFSYPLNLLNPDLSPLQTSVALGDSYHITFWR